MKLQPGAVVTRRVERASGVANAGSRDVRKLGLIYLTLLTYSSLDEELRAAYQRVVPQMTSVFGHHSVYTKFE